MAELHKINSEIAVVGWSCRLPGANSVAEFWSLLTEGRCAVSQIPADRWSLERFGHPTRQLRGRSYTWAAGVIDGIWDFDPSPFGISPREAEQMDPQQRLLLELTWEALEDAGVPPSSIAGSEIGVYVGGSSTDHGTLRSGDPAGGDSHFATGNALSILANRISYAFDLKGPSLTIDTACSSSLVALHHAVEALKSRRIDTAIVGGINALLSPYTFISFAQASMLSPTGRCRAFSADADGYVRGEGGVVLVLRRVTASDKARSGAHGMIVATDVNSDGRTNGIALPSPEAQEKLLKRIYDGADVDPNDVAFVEAHGTGTKAGDPIEAGAIGRAIGRRRAKPLPIGSVKTNIGHLEPAAGLAGLLKAMLALGHGELPRSLHLNGLNPHIAFDELNLSVAAEPVALAGSRLRYAGVNSFGFGGTNAHAIIAAAPVSKAPSARPAKPSRPAPLLLSAATSQALAATASRYASLLEDKSDAEADALARAVAHRRDRLAQRLVVTTPSADTMVAALAAAGRGEKHPNAVMGTAPASDLPIAFFYSGNGSQWVGMGRQAYRANAEFRAAFDEVDQLFRTLADWSLAERMHSSELPALLPLTSTAQPLIFAIQVATTAALAKLGVRPIAVLGHSVGEVAAAHAAGALDLATAVRVIHMRSKHQELAAGTGDMAALLASAEIAGALGRGIPGLEIAAYNSDNGVTVSGPAKALATFTQRAEAGGHSIIPLTLNYPFHSELMAPIEQPLLDDLAAIEPRDESLPFVSTVTGTALAGTELSPDYWWRNVREPVLFGSAVRAAADLGARLFIEIGPRATLIRHVRDCLAKRAGGHACLSVFDHKVDPSDPADPIAALFAQALVGGAAVAREVVFGRESDARLELPGYSWQRRTFRFAPSTEAVGYKNGAWHPLRGDRRTSDALEWHALLDTALLPGLADHQVGGQVILPGAAFLEIALSVAREWLGTASIVISEFEILKPLNLSDTEQREVLTRVSPGSSTLEILSRQRLSSTGWLVHARAKIFSGSSFEAQETATAACAPSPDHEVVSGARIYEIARQCGLDYGPTFRLAEQAVCLSAEQIVVELAHSPERKEFLLDPMLVDACFHGLFVLFPALQSADRGAAYIPVRIGETTFFGGGVPRRALIDIRRAGPRSILADFRIEDQDGHVVARLAGARFVAVQALRRPTLEHVSVVERWQPISERGSARLALEPADLTAAARKHGNSVEQDDLAAGRMFLEGFATAAAYEIAVGLAEAGEIDIGGLMRADKLPAACGPWLGNVLAGLRAGGLVEGGPERWRLLPDPLLPASRDIVAEIAAEFPSRAPELLLAGEFAAVANAVETEGRLAPETIARLSASPRDFHDTVSIDYSAALVALGTAVQSCGLGHDDGTSLGVLVVGGGAITRLAADALASRRLRIVTIEPAGQRSASPQLQPADDATPDARSALLDSAAGLADSSFDIVVSAGGLGHLTSDELAHVRRAMMPGGMLIATEPSPSLFRTLVIGLRDAGASGQRLDAANDGPRGSASWIKALATAGFEATEAALLASDGMGWILIAACAPELTTAARAAVHVQPAGTAFAGRSILLETPQKSALAQKLAARLNAVVGVVAGTRAAKLETPKLETLKLESLKLESLKLESLKLESGAEALMLLSPETSKDSAETRLARRCLTLKAAAACFSGRGKLWVVQIAGKPGKGEATEVDPIVTGIRAFCRTLANEHPLLDIRRIEIGAKLPAGQIVDKLGALLDAGTDETEIAIDHGAIRVMRAEALPNISRGAGAKAKAVRLMRSTVPGQRLQWQAVERPAPGPGEVEIEVAATGLNFRDLMWSMDMLPDDMLEDGFTGPSLGLECAGRVVRVGKGATHSTVGDRVVVMSPSAFSSHVVVGEDMLATIPDTISYEAAATLPVAFLTAYYGLVTQARLAGGEWVLIHGAAGAVGLAAIQIAQWRGANIIATAGSNAKRQMLHGLGVEHVLDSRSTGFVEAVRRITDTGVDVVLNSLAGEPMERSVHCLAPFGRFVELGKRDYVANTHLGLRPFRKNLSYFGVDVDQLIMGRREVGQEAFKSVIQLVRDGVLLPLPHSVFRGVQVADAFQLMQQSAHIGKIVVRPPDPASMPAATRPFVIDPARTHLVTGAFGGFGLATAEWLAERGAKHLVLLGRQGAASASAKAAVAALERRGVHVAAAACDIADVTATERLLTDVRANMPPIAGVIHAAMVLEDGLVANLDASQLERVLTPKVKGADTLDRLTRQDKLDYFVLYSSVTTLFGNPGQASYVAANGYLEGLATRRRRAGLPGLAVGWGPISNVGVVARDEKLKANLIGRRGLAGMTAADALSLLGDALGRAADDPELAVITIATSDWTEQAERLAVLRSPSYAGLVSERAANEADAEGIDLTTLVATSAAAVVKAKVMGVISGRLARVLHMREDDLDRNRPLAEMGLDSLMTFELASGLETAFNRPLALAGSVGTLSITSLADQIIAQAGRDQGASSNGTAAIEALSAKHFETIAPDKVAELFASPETDEGIRKKRVLS